MKKFLIALFLTFFGLAFVSNLSAGRSSPLNNNSDGLKNSAVNAKNMVAADELNVVQKMVLNTEQTLSGAIDNTDTKLNNVTWQRPVSVSSVNLNSENLTKGNEPKNNQSMMTVMKIINSNNIVMNIANIPGETVKRAIEGGGADISAGIVNNDLTSGNNLNFDENFAYLAPVLLCFNAPTALNANSNTHFC